MTADGTTNNFSAAALSKECVIVMYRFLFVLFLESRKDLGYFETVKGAMTFSGARTVLTICGILRPFRF